MLESCDLIAFVAATDLGRARTFYEQMLGLPVIEHTDMACVFDSGGTMLRVTAVAEAPKAGYTVLGWGVTDITAAVRDLAARGVTFLRFDGMNQDEDGIWTAPGGARVAWFADPNGNTLSLTQFRRPDLVAGTDLDALGEFFGDDSVWMVNDVARGHPGERGVTAGSRSDCATWATRRSAYSPRSTRLARLACSRKRARNAVAAGVCR